MTLLAAAAVGAALAYQAAARQKEYSALLVRGDTALRDDLTFNAIEAYSGAIALRPDSMLAYLRRGQTYQRRGDRGDLEAAARDLRQAAALDPTATRPLEALGDVLYQQQRYDRPADAYERCVRLDDRSARVAYKLALARYGSRAIEPAMAALAEALRAIERAVTLEPGLIPAREELADLYATADRRGDQLEQLQVLAALDRDHVARQIAVAMAHARSGHWDLAVLTLGNARDRNPGDPEIDRALGQVWLERPRDDAAFLGKAREALQRAASAPGATSQALTLYGRALLEAADFEGAERAFEQATTRYPIDPPAFLLYASAAERQGHFEAARTSLIRYGGLIESDADFVSRAARIASLSLRLDDAQAAVAWYERACASSPSDLHLVAALADAQLQAGSVDAASATIARGLERDPRQPQLRVLARRARDDVQRRAR